MKEITKTKSADIWITYDFVRYFYSKCDKIYGIEHTDTNIERDGQIMKTIITFFKKYDRPKRAVKTFIDWSLDKYVNHSKYTIPITIGFMSFWRWQYLSVKQEPKTKKIKKREDVVLSSSTLSWISKQKKQYKKGKGLCSRTKKTQN